MKRIKLTVSYDGTNYVGWQVQKNGIAIEQVLNEHLSALLGEDIKVIGASRTDSGVHAMGNIAVFDTETRIPSTKISLALNQSLPDDIKIAKSEEVDPDFHPRHADCTKTYRYSILNCRYNLPVMRLYTDYVYYPLDVEKMRKAAKYLLGEHDFTAFSTAGGQQKSPVRTIYSIDIDSTYLNPDADPSEDAEGGFRPARIDITVKGNGFLYNMVRIIAGTLEKVGMGIYPPEYAKEILESRDRQLSAPKASARGLTLICIDYL
ncbi:MAG: tRNA pseudouridine(38-40) synthase TruA [Lachnospiraceae bacterium]|nr:tRNA pseudouridine(38-40) synthase TruA [Lachnospiraceae bacterium]